MLDTKILLQNIDVIFKNKCLNIIVGRASKENRKID